MAYKPRGGKRGRRKIIFTEEQIKKIEQLASRGLTNEQIYNYLGLSKDTFYQRMVENPEIRATLEKGRAKGIANISNALFNQASNGNTTAMIFYLKCKAGWKETIISEVSDPNGVPVAAVTLITSDPVEAAKHYQDLISKN